MPNRFLLFFIVGFSTLLSPLSIQASNGRTTSVDTLTLEFDKLITSESYSKASEFLEEVKAQDNPNYLNHITYWQGILNIKTGLPELGMNQLLKAKETATVDKDTLLWANILLYLADGQTSRFPRNTVQLQIFEALQLLEAIQDTFGLVRGYYNLGTGLCAGGELDSCYTYLEKAQWLAYHGHRWGNLSTVLNYRGLNLFRRGEYRKSLPYCLASLRVYEKLGKKKDVARTYNLLGSTLHRLGESEMAVDYFYKGLNTAQDEIFEETEANILANLGVVLVEMGDYKESLEHYQRSLQIYRKMGDRIGESSMLTNTAFLYEQQGDLDLAIQFQSEALKIDQNIEDPYGMAISHFNLGDFHRQLEHFDISLDHLKTSEKLAVQIDYQGMFPEIYDRYAKCYKQMGEFEMALYFKEKCDSIKALTADPVQIDSAKSEVLAYEVEKKEEEIDALLEENSRKSNLVSILVWGAIGLLLVFVFAGFIFLRRQARNKSRLAALEEKQASLQGRNQNLAKNMADLTQNLEAKEILVHQLQSQKETPSSTLPEKLLEKVKQNSLWPGYMADFELLYPGFLERLAKTNPSLSPNDLRLLTLVKLNLNTAEIAEFLNITPAGVKKARQRIRKKIELPSDQNLGQYLNQI